MAQKVLTWSNSQLNDSRCNFHIFHGYFSSCTSEFTSGVKDLTCVYDL